MALTRWRLIAIGVAILAIASAGAATFALRGRIADVPLVGRLLAPSSKTATEAGGGAVPAAAESGATPRGAVRIDARRQQLIGVRTMPVERRSLTRAIRAVGLVRYDETRLSDVNLKLEGWIRELFVDSTGAFVEAGQPLFTLYSPELVTTQTEYLLALEARDRLRESQVADAREYADRLVESARERLVLWDLPADQIEALEGTRQPQTAMIFRSPVSGHVIDKAALQGLHVTPGQSLYRIADLSTVWVEADIYEQDVAQVRVGASAGVTLDAYPGERFSGRVVFVYPYVEEQARTVRVRFAFPNPDGRLRPGMYAGVELASTSGAGLVVPANAVLDSGREQLVFVAEGDGFFEPRPVTVGRRLDEGVEIVSGVAEGEMVASSAAFFLDSESQLRASLQAYEPPPAGTAGESAETLAVSFRSTPDPPRSGMNAFEVAVRAPGDQPVTDADVSVVFFMAAMPTMNMPAMRNETRLTHAGDGVYRGEGQVLMAGRWDVTVNVGKDGQRLGAEQLSVVAK